MSKRPFEYLRVVTLCICAFAAAARAADSPVEIGAGKQPQVVVIGKDAFITFGGPKNEIFFSRVRVDGVDSSKPVAVATPPHMALGMRRGPRIAAAGDALVITAIAGAKGGGKDGDVLAWRTTDKGKTWRALAKPLNTVAGAPREGLHGLGGGSDGLMICVWLDLRNVEKGGTEIWGTISHDAGESWSDDFQIYRSPVKTVCQCCHPSAAIDPAGNISVMFRNALAGNRDMYIVRSDNHGKSFGKATKIGRKSWPLDACPMDGGSISSGKSTPTVWRRAEEIFEASPGAEEILIGKGQQPSVAADDQNRYIAWITARPGDLMLKIGDAESKKIATNAGDPAISAGLDRAGPVLLVWESGAKVMAMNVRSSSKARPTKISN